MEEMQRRNVASSANNPNENWMAEKLELTGYKWRRQARWGYRIFDFWCHHLGIAVEVDGPEHDPDYDGYRDRYNYFRSGIVVLRVKNKDEQGAEAALEKIKQADTWVQRREKMGIKKGSKKQRRKQWQAARTFGELGID